MDGSSRTLKALNASHSKPHVTRELSSFAFLVVWCCVLVLHGVCCVYFLVAWWFYGAVPNTFLADTLYFYGLGWQGGSYETLSALHGVFAVLHAFGGAVMTVWSVWRRRLSFGPWYEPSFLARMDTAWRTASVPMLHRIRGYSRITRWTLLIARRLFGRRGLFGIDGAYFELIHLLRQGLEGALQSYQAYRMSIHVPRSRLNRLYVALIVLNCWLPSMLQGLGVHDKARRLILLLLCDASLELVASIGIPAVLVHTYYPDFNFRIRAFPGFLWYNDAWVIRATNEFRLIHIITPLDLFSRLAFSIGLLWCLEGIKDLTRRNGSPLSRVGPSLRTLQSPKPSLRDLYPEH